MDWLWLLLSLAGLGLLWLLIMALDKLVLRLKEHDEARKITIKSIKQRTAEAEAELLEKQYLMVSTKRQLLRLLPSILQHCLVLMTESDQSKSARMLILQFSTVIPSRPLPDASL